jgi:myo-inositol-1(or 4)-monophosphatase
MFEHDWESICKQTIPIVREAAAFIHKEHGKVKEEEIEEKELNSFVSYVDREAEKILVSHLGEIIPGSTFFTEEDTVQNKDSEYTWVIDPLDGTTNFLQMIPFYSVSVALRYHGRIVVGIIHEIVRSEVFYSWESGGSYMNGEKISVSSQTDLEKAIVATGFPYKRDKRTDQYLDVLLGLIKNTRAIRRLGSAALDLAYVASGKFDVFYEFNLNPWDVSAGALIIMEAGGELSGFYQVEEWKTGKTIIAGNKHMVSQLKEYIAHSTSL